jgi:23S rRNA (guanosine2251-2'-O)-methyltransferase
MKKFRRPEGRPTAKGRPPHGRAQASAQAAPRGRAVVGIHAVTELLKVRPRAITQFWLREKYSDHPSLKSLFENAQRTGVKVHVHPVGALDKLVSAHQGVVAFTDQSPEIDWPALEKLEFATLIALDEVEDPHNLGAVMRTAWLLGAQGILTSDRRSASLTPAVSKVAQGAVEHVPVEADTALPQRLEHLKKQGFWVLGLSHEGSTSLFNFKIPEKVVWVLGSESSGLRKSVAGICDDFVTIPQSEATASYNVSVAAAIALAETFRQRIP